MNTDQGRKIFFFFFLFTDWALANLGIDTVFQALVLIYDMRDLPPFQLQGDIFCAAIKSSGKSTSKSSLGAACNKQGERIEGKEKRRQDWVMIFLLF